MSTLLLSNISHPDRKLAIIIIVFKNWAISNVLVYSYAIKFQYAWYKEVWLLDSHYLVCCVHVCVSRYMETTSQPAQKFTHYAVERWTFGLTCIIHVSHMIKMDSSVGKSTVELDAIRKQFTVFFIRYKHKMYSPFLGIKLQGKVTFCINYLSKKSIDRLFTEFMVVILVFPTRHVTNYDTLHPIKHMNTYICMTWW